MFEDFSNRLKKVYRLRKRWADKQKTNAYRLYEKDIPEYPYAVDLYGEHVVVYDLSIEDAASEPTGKRPKEKMITVISDALNIKPEQVIFKRRKRMKGADQYEKQAEKKIVFSVQEGPAQFEVNLTSYLDTGLFLDHRPLRAIVHQQADGKKFLNLFAYTGSISVMAALGGAQCTTVDLSNTYQAWSRRNFTLNGINPEKHEFVASDVLIYLKNTNQTFDLIVLDPPTFSNSKKTKQVLDIQRDHSDYIHACARQLNSDGTLYFSTNNRRFKLDPELENFFNIEKISPKTIPEDFRDKKVHQAWKIQHRLEKEAAPNPWGAKRRSR